MAKKRPPSIDAMTKYQMYVAGLRAAGKRLTSYRCPVCAFVIETLAPGKGDTFDTMVDCPSCRKPHFRIVRQRPRAAGSLAQLELTIYCYAGETQR